MSDLGAAIVNPGTPLMHAKTVTADGVKDVDDKTKLTGFTTVEADTIDAAIEMAKSCPYLDVGQLQVAEMMQMPS